MGSLKIGAGDLEFWIDSNESSESGDGSEASPWGPEEGLEKLRVELEQHFGIRQCVVHLLGDGTILRPLLPFDGSRFTATGTLVFRGEDFEELATGLTASAASTRERLVLTESVGSDEYQDCTLEAVSTTNALNSSARRTIRGYQRKKPVAAAATESLTLSGEQTVDGVALSDGDRVLCPGQTTAAESGIHIVRTGSWERAKDADSVQEIDAAKVEVLSGTSNGGKTFYQASSDYAEQAWSTDDLVVLPAYWFPAVLDAGDTFRIVKAAVKIDVGGPATNFPFTVGFGPGHHQVFQKPNEELPLGVAISNVSFTADTPFTYLTFSASTVTMHGVRVDDEARLGYEGTSLLSGYFAREELSGSSVNSAWLGWGTYVKQNMRLDGGVNFYGILHAGNGIFASALDPFKCTLIGGRIGGLDGGEAEVQIRITTVAFFEIGFCTVPFLFDRCRLYTTGPKVVLSNGVFSYITSGSAVRALFPGTIKIFNNNYGPHGHSEWFGLNAASGGHISLEFGNPNLTGDKGDCHLSQETFSWSDLATNQAGFAESKAPHASGGVISRLETNETEIVYAAEQHKRGTFAYSSSVTLDVRERNNWQMLDCLSGDTTLTLTNGADGYGGRVLFVNDGSGGHVVSFVAAGRTVLVSGTQPAAPDAVFETTYEYASVDGTGYLLLGYSEYD